jgi:hypothetical protein
MYNQREKDGKFQFPAIVPPVAIVDQLLATGSLRGIFERLSQRESFVATVMYPRVADS